MMGEGNMCRQGGGSARKTRRSRVYATFYTGGAGYLRGVLALARSLQRSGCSYQLVVFVTPNVGGRERSIIESEGSLIRQVEGIEAPEAVRRLNEAGGFGHWNTSFTKLRILSATEFEKVVQLDSDMLIVRNIDCLFDRPHLSACAARQAANPSWRDLNSGCLVIEPEANLCDCVMHTLDLLDDETLASYQGIGDQDLLHLAFPDWPGRNDLHLSEEYNLLSDNAARYAREGVLSGGSASIVHLAFKPKPWNMGVRGWLSVAKRALRWRSLAEVRYIRSYRKMLGDAPAEPDWWTFE